MFETASLAQELLRVSTTDSAVVPQFALDVMKQYLQLKNEYRLCFLLERVSIACAESYITIDIIISLQCLLMDGVVL